MICAVLSTETSTNKTVAIDIHFIFVSSFNDLYATKIVNINANEKIFLTKPRSAYDETDKQQPLYPLSLQHEETSDFQIAAALYYLLATHCRHFLDTIPQYVDQYMRSNASHHLHKRQLYASEPISMQPSAEKSDTHQADEAFLDIVYSTLHPHKYTGSLLLRPLPVS